MALDTNLNFNGADNAMYDPSPILTEFLAQMEALAPVEQGRIARARRDGRDPGNKAWNNAQAALARTGREASWQAAAAAIGALSLPELARYGVYDAALAILVRDVISADDFAALYAQIAAGGERQRAII